MSPTGWPKAGRRSRSRGGLGLALGFLRPWASAFTIAATLMLLDFWRFQDPQREGMRSDFLVNSGLLGGLILAFGQSL